MLRELCVIGCWLLSASALFSHEGHEHKLTTEREKLVEALLAERESEAALEKLISDARESHISEQAILEARFLFYTDREEDQKVSALLPNFLSLKENFRLSESIIFASSDDWLAVIEYVSAMAALQKGDQAGFKQHITEAFWYSPHQGAAFAPHVERIRLNHWMKEAELDLQSSYIGLFDQKPLRLSDTTKNKKALLLHFWSPQSEECQRNMVDFLRISKNLEQQEIGVVSILPETSPDVIKLANQLLLETGKQVSGSWIIDSSTNFLCETLKVKSLPLCVVLTPEGKVLFHGHPTQHEFWDTLASINPNIQAPKKIKED